VNLRDGAEVAEAMKSAIFWNVAPILITLMMVTTRFSETSVLKERTA
jgi:heme/copper-type cytochrome/quinol oxidase subunit 2